MWHEARPTPSETHLVAVDDCGRHQREARHDGEQTENEGNVAGEGAGRADWAGAAGLRHHRPDLRRPRLYTACAHWGRYGKTWLGLEVNGWSGLLFVAAGLLLLLGAPMHWGAKGLSLIVGIALAVLCLIALANGNGALGIFAANGLTELVWGAAGALLIVLSLLPRVGGETKHRYEHSAPTGTTPRVEPEHRTAHATRPAARDGSVAF